MKEISCLLENNNIKYENVPWYEDGFILNNANEKDMQQLNIYEEGKIYLQNLSSMIPAIVLNPKTNESVLDMCAAPGGKTTQLSALSNNTCLITACEKNKIRAERLKYNIDKQGANKVTILKEDARNLSEFFSFDKILLDSPCSGSGTINFEDKNLKKYFTEDLIMQSVKKQQMLLKKAISILKSGHEIVYSTCSILKEENEANIKRIIKDGRVEIIPIDKEQFANIPLLTSSIDGVLTVCPTEYYEGFFISKLRKK